VFLFVSGTLTRWHKLLSLTHKQTNHNLISVQPCHNTRSSSMVTLTRPPFQSSLKITNRSFRFAAPCLWSERPTDLREPCQIQSPSLSPITHGSSSSSSSTSLLSPLAFSLTRSVFHSELKICLFGKSFPPQTFSFPTGLILRTLGPFNVFILLSGWICLHSRI